MNGMVSCKSCAAVNSLDSAFCKKCGTTLPADDLQQAREKLEATVADGFRIFNAGRTDEAMQVAETAVQANPSSTAALSLKAMCHERLGQIAESLECHEKVLEIDPDSMIDKIKVNDLRNLVIARSSVAAVPDRRLAAFTAVAAFVLILSIGVVLAKGGGRSNDRVASNLPNTNLEAKGARMDSQSSNLPVQPQQSNNSTQNQSGNSGQGDGQRNQSTSDQGSARRNTVDDGAGLSLPQGGGHSLPNPDGNVPVILDPDQRARTALNTGPTATQNPAPVNHDSARSQDPPPSDDPPLQSNQTKQEAPGIMDIQITSGRGKSASDSSDPSTHPNGVQALLRTARSQYQIGSYSAAANSYERALRAGADQASGNQRLAECYEKLGRNAEAVAAYNRAIDALQSAIDGGRGDKARLSNALDVCKQAVKVLGG